MQRRSLSAYDKFLLAQASDSHDGGLLLEGDDEEGARTETGGKPSNLEEEKRLNEPLQLDVSTSSSSTLSLATPLAPTVRQHASDERKTPTAAVSSWPPQRELSASLVEQRDEQELKKEESDDEQAAAQVHLSQASAVQGQSDADESDDEYAGADEVGLLDDIDSLPIETLSPLPAPDDEGAVDEEEPELEDEDEDDEDGEEEEEWAPDTLSPLPQQSLPRHAVEHAMAEYQLDGEGEASEPSVDDELDDKIHAHKAALSHYTLQAQQTAQLSPKPTPTAADDAALLSTVREGNEDDDLSSRILSSSSTPTAGAHRWFSDLVNRPAFLSPNSPTAPPSRFSLSSRHSTPNERPSHAHKRSSLPSPLPSSLHSSFHHPDYNSPSAFFAAKSGHMGTLSGSRSNRPSFSTSFEAPAAGELGSPSAVGKLSFTPFRRSGGKPNEPRRAEEAERRSRYGVEQRDEEEAVEKNTNRSLIFQSPLRAEHVQVAPRSTHRSSLPPRSPSSYPPAPATASTAPARNVHLFPSAHLRHCHLFLHFHSTLPHATLQPLVASTLRHHIPAAPLYTSLTDKGSRRWVMMCILEGEGRWMDERAGWSASVENVLVGYGMSELDFVVLLPSMAGATAAAS